MIRGIHPAGLSLNDDRLFVLADDAEAIDDSTRIATSGGEIGKKKNPVARARHAQPALLVRRGRFPLSAGRCPQRHRADIIPSATELDAVAVISFGDLVMWRYGDAETGEWPNHHIDNAKSTQCGRQESNLHGLPHGILSPARLPVPPRPRRICRYTIIDQTG